MSLSGSAVSAERLRDVPFAPTFRPSLAEFRHPFAYLRSIRSRALPFGICKIVPPDDWKQPCALDFARTRFGTKAQRIDQLMRRDATDAEAAGRGGGGGLGGGGGGGGRPRAMKAGRSAITAVAAAAEAAAGEKAASSPPRRPVGRPRKVRRTLSSASSSSSSSSAASEPELRRSSSSGSSQPAPVPEESVSASCPAEAAAAVQSRPLPFSDSASFIRSLGRWLQSACSPPLRLPAHLLMPDTHAAVNLYELYQCCAHCGGVDAVEATLGWEAVLELSNVPDETQARQLWTQWLQAFSQAAQGDEQQHGGAGKGKRRRRAGPGEEEAGEGADSGEEEAAPRRSTRERKQLVPPAALFSSPSSFASASDSSRFDDGLLSSVCSHCAQSDHQACKLLCLRCEQVTHSFCLSPPAPSAASVLAAAGGSFLCRSCIGSFGFDSGGSYTLEQFRRQADAFLHSTFRLRGRAAPLPTADAIAAEFWRIVELGDHAHPVCVEYGSDLDTQDTGSVFPASGPLAADGWNLRNLPRLTSSVLTLLEEEGGGGIEGISIPWLYVGMLFSAFCWHNEDHYSYSINYVAEGAAKHWYGVPGPQAAEFERCMAGRLPQLFAASPDLLSHLITMLPPTALSASAPVYQLLQQAGEIVLTFPQAYHCGFNHGFNVAESVNFAPHDWLPYGLQSAVRYRFFHREAVWCSQQVVLAVARAVIAQQAERRQQGRDKLQDDAEREARGELPLWERAAWLYPVLCWLREEELSLRRALYAAGTVRMRPWPAAEADEQQSSRGRRSFRIGDSVQFGQGRSGLVVGVLAGAVCSVRDDSDGLVQQLEATDMQRLEREEDRRTHDWSEAQNIGGAGAAAAASASASSSSALPRCLVCREVLYLSCVRCSCREDKAACLRHAAELCSCVAKSKHALFRQSVAELDDWCGSVADILSLSSDTEGQRAAAAAAAAAHSLHPQSAAILSIIAQSDSVLRRPDLHVEETRQRLQGGREASGASGGVGGQLGSGSWSASMEAEWRSRCAAWLSACRPLLGLSEPSVSCSEVQALLMEGERFVWADARAADSLAVYRALSSWTAASQSLSFQLCSLALQHGRGGGGFSLSAARELLSRLQRCPVLCSCVCASIEQSQRAKDGDERGRVPPQQRRQLEREAQRHLQLLAELIEDAEWREAVSPAASGLSCVAVLSSPLRLTATQPAVQRAVSVVAELAGQAAAAAAACSFAPSCSASAAVQRLELLSSVTHWLREEDGLQRPQQAAALSAPQQTLPSLPQLRCWLAALDACPPAAERRLAQASAVLRCAVAERAVSGQVCLSHAARLLAAGGAALVGADSWQAAAGVRCSCRPVLSASASGLPSIALCRADHALPAASSASSASSFSSSAAADTAPGLCPAASAALSHRSRHGLCCVDAVLRCSAAGAVSLPELGLLRHARRESLDWEERARHRLQADAAPCSPSLLRGLLCEAAELLLSPPSLPALRRRLQAVSALQREAHQLLERWRPRLDDSSAAAGEAGGSASGLPWQPQWQAGLQAMDELAERSRTLRADCIELSCCAQLRHRMHERRLATGGAAPGEPAGETQHIERSG